MMLRTIRSAQGLSGNRIRLAWANGSVVNLGPPLAKGGVFAFLRDPAAFDAVAVGPRGRTLIWRDPEGDEIDLCTDALWRLAHHGTIEAGDASREGNGFLLAPFRLPAVLREPQGFTASIPCAP